MKSFFLILSVCLLSLGAMSQPKASEIIARHNKVSGLDKLNAKSSLMMEASISTPQGDMPLKMIIAPGSKYRIETSMGGMDLLMVVDGSKAWIKMPGQGVQQVPTETIQQIVSQGDLINSMKMTDNVFNFTYDSEKDGQHILKGTAKEGVDSKGVTDIIVFFDKATGLNTKTISTIEVQGKKLKVTSRSSKNKTFGTITIPTLVTIEIEGANATSTVNIKNIELDYPTAAWMFVEPK